MAVRNRLLGVIAGANRVDLIVDALSTWVNATSACVPQWAIDEFWKGVVPVDPLYPAHWTILGESAIALEAAVMDPGACSFSEPRERFTNAELALHLADLIALTDAVYAPAAMSVPPKLHLSLATAICYLRDVAYNAQARGLSWFASIPSEPTRMGVGGAARAAVAGQPEGCTPANEGLGDSRRGCGQGGDGPYRAPAARTLPDAPSTMARSATCYRADTGLRWPLALRPP